MIRSLFTVSQLLGLAALTATLAVSDVDARPAKRGEIDAFKIADVNGDRLLDRKEFKVFVGEMARRGQPTARKIRFFGAYGFAFNKIDANRDRLLTPEELKRADSKDRAERGANRR